MTVLGSEPPSSVVINELTTIASVWTHAQFVGGAAIEGHALGLRIAAGNVPNFVDLTTGGLGPVIQDPLNSSQTTTLATFNTLGDLLAGCETRVRADACDKLFGAATPRGGTSPTDTLAAVQNIARGSVSSSAEAFRSARRVLSRPCRKTLARSALRPLSQLRAECLDPLASLCRRRNELAGWHRNRWRRKHVVSQQLHAWRAVHYLGPVRRRRVETRAHRTASPCPR